MDKSAAQRHSEQDVLARVQTLVEEEHRLLGQGAGSDTEHDRLARVQVELDQCAGCHMQNGEGIAGVFPPLKGNNVVQASDPETVVHIILTGAKTATTKKKPTGLAMPAFDWKLDDAQVADLATYLRNAWGNHANAVDASKVADTRRTLVAARTK